MSKLSDYSKFDHLDDSDGEEGPPSQAAGDASQQLEDVIAPAVATTRKDPRTGRYVFVFGGNTIYEWEQSLEGRSPTMNRNSLCSFRQYHSCYSLLFTVVEMNMYVTAPQGVKALQLLCNISSNRLQL
jgi:hypothetical protein